MDTCFNYSGSGHMYMSSDERRWIDLVHQLALDYPDECIIVKEPEHNHGYIYCKFPQKWLRVKPPKRLTITDEERERRKAFINNVNLSRQNDASRRVSEHDESV